ncbi:MAG: type IV toxin-antitoxin system AbiEi family antitoxin domain-containing protein [bacterium]|nr:type IV toxin-antitoxin system AbiEi family antitoxin domain-containing protein [bacterium]
MPRKVADFQRLYQLAAGQAGHFTTRQAAEAGYTRSNLAYHAAQGRFERVAQGLYRLRDFPASPHEDVIAAWVRIGPERAVASHETALRLFDLSTAEPRKIHLTVHRRDRPRNPLPLKSVRIHSTTRQLRPDDVRVHAGVRVTAPARTIADAAEAGTDPSHIVEAVAQGLGRGLITAGELLHAASDRPGRVKRLIERAIEEARAHAGTR